MEIKIFGRNLFSTNKGDILLNQAFGQTKKSKYLQDFYTLNDNPSPWGEFMSTSSITQDVKQVGTETKNEDKKGITPKEVWNLKMLHDKTFTLKIDPAYISKQLEAFKEKLGLIKSEEFDIRRGVNQIASIVTRLENRQNYPKFAKFFEEYPYTTTSKINELVEKHDNLKLGQVAQFIADMPKEAVQIMKEYTEKTRELCEKKAVFYIIADKKDFNKTNERRDPILLAQSPFGHFWQILGAWDEEMMFIEEL